MKVNLKKITFLNAVLIAALFVFSQGAEARYNTKYAERKISGDQSAGPTRAEFVPGEVLVKYKDSVTNSTANRSTEILGYRVKKRIVNNQTNRGPMHLVRTRGGADIQSEIQNIQQNSNVEYAQPNYIYRAMMVPNDASYGQLWAMKNIGQSITGASYATSNPGTAGKDIDAENAWNLQSDCSAVTVAVIDSGVNYTQEDLINNMAVNTTPGYTCPLASTGTYGCDFVGAGGPDPMDLNGHGTHVAGTIGAQGNNGTGVTGVCQTAKILAARALDASGSGTTADIVEAFNWAVGTAVGQGHAKIVNLSLGGGGNDTAFANAITAAEGLGVVVVVAAGNSASNHSQYSTYPCDYDNPNIICVAAADQRYLMASFSDYDINPTAASRKVDVGAPGTNILSAYAGTETLIEDTYSSATPFGIGTYNAAAWSLTGGWGYEPCDFGFGTIVDLIQNPSDTVIPNSWCSWGTAGDLVNGIAYATYDLSGGYSSIVLDFYASIDLTSSGDVFNVLMDSAGGNLTALTRTVLDSYWGPEYTGGYLYGMGYDITACNTATCSLGFEYKTDGITNMTYDSVAVAYLSIIGLANNSNTYVVLNGTSMATPVTAGIAAMLYAHNPNYTYADVVEAVVYGGDSETAMSGKTKSGMVVDAYKALKYLPAPKNVVVY